LPCTDSKTLPNRLKNFWFFEGDFMSVKPKDIQLPKPVDPGGKTVFQALQARQTIRELSSSELDIQQISNVLWAAKGVNRKRGAFGVAGVTAASASNSQEVDVHVLLPSGGYFYEPAGHVLHCVSSSDHRQLALTQGQHLEVPLAPMHLVFIADIDKLEHTKGFDEPRLHNSEGQKSYYFVDTGIIAGNVYLYAASVGLGAWFHNCHPSLHDILQLRSEQRVLFAQSIGYPRGEAK
jgi:nitroreductase